MMPIYLRPSQAKAREGKVPKQESFIDCTCFCLWLLIKTWFLETWLRDGAFSVLPLLLHKVQKLKAFDEVLLGGVSWGTGN